MRRWLKPTVWMFSTAAVFAFLQFTWAGLLLQWILHDTLGSWGYLIMLGGALIAVGWAALRWWYSRELSLLAAALLCVLVATVASNGWWTLRENSRNARMRVVSAALEDLLSRHQALPPTLEADARLKKQASFFGLDRISYRPAEGGFEIESCQVPLGPFEGYSSREKAWTSFE